MARGLAILLVAVPVFAWLLTAIALLAVYDVTTGTPIAGWEWGLGAAMVAGGALVLAISANAVWRARAHVGWRVYGALLAAGAIAGVAGGVWLAGGEILRREEGVTAHATELCGRFDMPSATCPDVARRCIAHVRAHPPEIGRGLQGPPPSDPRAPREAVPLAEWQCIQRGGP